MLTLRRAFAPSRYRFGRPVAALCILYLALLAAAAGIAVVDAIRPDPTSVGASFAAVPLVALSAPASLLTTPIIQLAAAFLLEVLPIPGAIVTVGVFLVLFALGAAQAAVVFLLLRGPAASGGDHSLTKS